MKNRNIHISPRIILVTVTVLTLLSAVYLALAMDSGGYTEEQAGGLVYLVFNNLVVLPLMVTTFILSVKLFIASVKNESKEYLLAVICIIILFFCFWLLSPH